MSELPPATEASPRDGANTRGIRIATGSRLHFGLLNTVEPFGGVGVMIDRPPTYASVTRCVQYAYQGPQASRVQEIARRVARYAQLKDELPGCRIHVDAGAPAHYGLGSGTQLSMAIAEGICRCLEIEVEQEWLSTRLAARGSRSSVGVHGYFQGGLIFEASEVPTELNPIQQRVTLPETWRVAVLHRSGDEERVHGGAEIERFATLPEAESTVAQSLWRIVCDDLMPSAAAGDFEGFATSVHQYNRTSGMLFAPVQGGPYNGQGIADLVHWLTDRGVIGVGQSSWGPGVFAWFETAEKAEPILTRLPDGVQLIALAQVKNQGRNLENLERL